MRFSSVYYLSYISSISSFTSSLAHSVSSITPLLLLYYSLHFFSSMFFSSLERSRNQTSSVSPSCSFPPVQSSWKRRSGRGRSERCATRGTGQSEVPLHHLNREVVGPPSPRLRRRRPQIGGTPYSEQKEGHRAPKKRRPAKKTRAPQRSASRSPNGTKGGDKRQKGIESYRTQTLGKQRQDRFYSSPGRRKPLNGDLSSLKRDAHKPQIPPRIAIFVYSIIKYECN